jgi:phage terminase large subunit-like protein
MRVDLTVTPFQNRILQSKADITVVSAGRGAGKTALMSILSIVNIMKGKTVMVIGPIWRNLKDSNFKQTLKFLNRMKVPYKVNKSELRVTIGKGEIIHVSGDTPETIRSYSSVDVAIFDEAASLHEDCWTLAVGIMRDTTDGDLKFYVVGTPPADEHHWMAQLAKREDVNVIFGSYKDNPYNGEKYVRMLEREYEKYSEGFKRRELFGEFLFDNADGSLFDNFNIEINNLYSVSRDYPIVCGLDIGGKGRDFTCAAVKQNNQVLGIHLRKTGNETELKNFVKEIYIIHGFGVLRYDLGNMAHLLEFDLPGVEIVPVNFGGAGGERFKNMRTAMYFHLRHKNAIYMSESIWKEHGNMLKSELRATRAKEADSRKLALIEKDEIKKIIGRSPDRADALVLSDSHVEVKKRKPRIAPLVFGRN